MDRIRIGLIGAGNIAKRHLSAIDKVDTAELAAIVDPAPAAGAIAKSRGVPVFGDMSSLVGSIELDAVIVATPTEHHLAPTLAALDAGLAVLVEKPICATVAEAEQIIAKSVATGQPVLVGHQRRYYPEVERAREIVQDGAFGPLVAVVGQWTLRKDVDYYLPDWRKTRTAGPVLTNLIHDLDSTRYICGEIDSIMAETANSAFGWEKEDAAALVLRFANGALGSFVLSDQATSPWSWELALGENLALPHVGENAMRFMGRDASLEFPNLKIWRHDGEPHDWTQPISSQAMSFEPVDPYVKQMQHFCAVIRREEAPRIDARDAMRTLAATVAVFDAARLGRRVVIRDAGRT